MWKLIQNYVKSLTSLVSLSIDLVYNSVDHNMDEFTSYLLKDILFMSTSLKNVYVRSAPYGVVNTCFAFDEKQVSSIEHMTLIGISIDLKQLYSVTPFLRTLHTTLNRNQPTHIFRMDSSENLKRLSLDICNLYFSTIEQLLYPMKKLTDSTITADHAYHDMANGAAWEQILTKIISFKFSFNFHASTWIKEPILPDSFQSPFWLEKKQWYTGYDRCTVSEFSLLYSLPYILDTYPFYAIKGPVETKSTGPTIQPLNNVKRLDINIEYPIDHELLCRLKNSDELYTRDSKISFRVLLDTVIPYIDMSRITRLIITGGMATGSAFSNVLRAKEDLQKSSEQLEQEKQSILSQRIPSLQLDGKTKDYLIEKAKEFHELLQQLHGGIYELTERFERQKYDMVELSERARQIEKGKAKTRKSNIVHTGLGGGLFTGVNDITSQAPAKVSLFSRYERVTDRRTYKDRRDVWAAEKQKADFVSERPKAKIKQVAESSEDSTARKPRRAAAAPKQKSEEKSEDLPPPPPPAEEEEEQEAPPAPEESAAEEPATEEEPAAATEEQNEEQEEEEE
ncbi:hypothetical protein I4U23_009665 [Adineta vaga]|nr:hypothetical protein I4U23_009665 [Adineta vaga]